MCRNSMEYQRRIALVGVAPTRAHTANLRQISRRQVTVPTGLLGWLITILDVISLEAFVPDAPRDRRGLARTFVSVLGIPNTSVLIDRLGADKSLRRVSVVGNDAHRFRPKPRFPAPSRSSCKAICPIKCMRR